MKTFFRPLAITLLSLIITNSINGQGTTQSGNGKQGMGGCSGTNPFDPYTGNVQRVIQDLEVWGGVGEVPLVWTRYGNSRNSSYNHLFGKAHNWNASFMYTMKDDGFDQYGQPQVMIIFPDEGEFTFARDVNDTTHWASGPEVNRHVFQDGNNFYLQLANGYRYRFEKLNDGSGTYYLLRDFFDCYQNRDTLIYDSNKRLIQVTEPAGRYLSITYGTFGSVAAITHVSSSDGRSVNYNYDVFNDGITDWVRLISVDYGDGTQAVYEYSQTAPGNRPHLSHAIDPRLSGPAVNMKYTYDADVEGFIHEEINGVTDELMTTLTATTADKIVCYANGKVETFHDPSSLLGRVKVYTDGLGRTTEYTYADSSTGFLKTATDALGRVTTINARTIYNNPLKITYPDGSTEKWTRDDLDLILTHTDELGRKTTYTRDSNHRVTRIDYPDGTFETFSYNDFGEVLTYTHRNGGVDSSFYNTTGLRTKFTDALGNVTAYTHDSVDRLAAVIDARSDTTGFEYNERGLLIKMTNADSTFKTYSYDDFGNRTSTTDEAGHTWTSSYDEFKRIVTRTDPLNRTTLYDYDLPGGICGCTHAMDKPTKITLPSGKSTVIRYDVEWQKISETVGAGTADSATTNYEYDLVKKLHIMFDPRGNPWTYEYDLRNRRISMSDPLTHATQWTYDAVGNNLVVTRPDGGTATNVYNNMNRLTQTTNPNGEVTKFKYDAEGNMIKLTDARNHTYSFEYDLLNRKTKMTYPGGSFEQWTYDAVSNVATYTNRAGDIRTYTYDNRNREILSDWSDNTPDVNRTYSPDNLLLTMSSSVSTLTYTYNAAHELTSETQAIAGGPAHAVNYIYNDDGLRSTLTNTDGSTVSYNYTGRNQVASISVDAAPPLSTYTYDLNGNRLTKELENGTTTDYTWDDANRNTSIDPQNSSGSFARFDYGYDVVNRRTFVQRDNDKGDTYSYDAIDQVTDVKYDVTDPGGVASGADRTVNYDWDAAGNRNTVTDDSIPTTYVSNGKNQYTNIGADALTYTVNGDLKTFNGWTYTYDAQDRMIKAKKGSTTVKFSYDARNRCVKRTINGTITFFYFDDWNLIDERNTSDAQLARYVNGAMVDEILSKNSSGSSVYYHEDVLGNVVRLTDNAGNIAEQYSYDVFGAPTIKDGIGNGLTETAYGNRFLFTGREFIQEIGLYDYRNRIYSSYFGRFLQVDPIRFNARDVSLYRYVRNNPINLKDPFGNTPCTNRPATSGWMWGNDPGLYTDPPCTGKNVGDECTGPKCPSGGTCKASRTAFYVDTWQYEAGCDCL
ncbi:MAG TPA: RHS repeat-associated core domain-containing protein [Chitinophagales bacterium]|nr:RHS repeat-associated core domain-containing protein [Chitinophagales bacterium]